MRIVGGRWRGRPLVAPHTAAIRPTTDRLRERIFDILSHGGDVAWEGLRVIDLFAGTGALGLEALSRGAAFSLFVDDGTEARALLRENVTTLGAAGQTRIFRRDATKLGRAEDAPFGLAFLDPPYGFHLAEAALAGLADGGWLVPGALCVVEESARSPLAPPPGFTSTDTRTQGDTQIAFLRYAA